MATLTHGYSRAKRGSRPSRSEQLSVAATPDRGEVPADNTYTGTDITDKTSSVTTYDYDPIGNRAGSVVGAAPAPITTTYTANQLNQYSTGTKVAHYEYSPFGRTTVATRSHSDIFKHRFSTKYLDVSDPEGSGETGLYYYGHRSYNPHLGRWLNRDPIGERGGMNLMGFVGNAPVQSTDDKGMYLFDFSKVKDFGKAVEINRYLVRLRRNASLTTTNLKKLAATAESTLPKKCPVRTELLAIFREAIKSQEQYEKAMLNKKTLIILDKPVFKYRKVLHIRKTSDPNIKAVGYPKKITFYNSFFRSPDINTVAHELFHTLGNAYNHKEPGWQELNAQLYYQTRVGSAVSDMMHDPYMLQGLVADKGNGLGPVVKSAVVHYGTDKMNAVKPGHVFSDVTKCCGGQVFKALF